MKIRVVIFGLLLLSRCFAQNSTAASTSDSTPQPYVLALELVSDARGVDFSTYLENLKQHVKKDWVSLIKESDRMKKGKLAIQFAITKEGTVAGMKLIVASGDVALDRAAWGGITASNPFPALPSDFCGQYLGLRSRFFCNPDRSELETPSPYD